MSAHLLPIMRWTSMSCLSSSSVHASLLMSGRSWLCHLSLHCLPIRPGKWRAIALQFPSPYSSTSLECIRHLSDSLAGWIRYSVAARHLFASSRWQALQGKRACQCIWTSSTFGFPHSHKQSWPEALKRAILELWKVSDLVIVVCLVGDLQMILPGGENPAVIWCDLLTWSAAYHLQWSSSPLPLLLDAFFSSCGRPFAFCSRDLIRKGAHTWLACNSILNLIKVKEMCNDMYSWKFPTWMKQFVGSI